MTRQQTAVYLWTCTEVAMLLTFCQEGGFAAAPGIVILLVLSAFQVVGTAFYWGDSEKELGLNFLFASAALDLLVVAVMTVSNPSGATIYNGGLTPSYGMILAISTSHLFKLVLFVEPERRFVSN